MALYAFEVFILGLLGIIIGPYILILVRRSRLKRFGAKFGLKYEKLHPQWKIYWRTERVGIHKVSGIMKGHSVEIIDEILVFGLFMGGFIAMSRSFSPIPYKDTKIIIDGIAVTEYKFVGFADINSLEKKISGLTDQDKLS